MSSIKKTNCKFYILIKFNYKVAFLKQTNMLLQQKWQGIWQKPNLN